jgi:3D (Asp-Asp-Asp) domain-containing protein
MIENKGEYVLKKLLLNVSAALLLFFGFSNATFASGTTYQVKKGDTLWSISKKHNITVQQLKTWNKLTSDLIKINQTLKTTGTAAVKTAQTAKAPAAAAAYKEIKVTATAYTASCKGCSGITYTGLNLKKNPYAKVISVDPRIIPLGSKVYVPGYGMAIAADKGSAVKGNKIDVFISNKQRALQWGNKTITIKVYK